MRDTIVPMVVYHRASPIIFTQALMETQREMGKRFLPLIANSSALPNRARTLNGQEFLASQAEWALLLDDDMAWVPESVKRLLKTAKETGTKAVSGFTFIEKEIEGKPYVFPHAYQIVPFGEGLYAQLPHAALPSMEEPFKVHAVGGACFLVHRDIYQALAEQARGVTAYPWQEEVYQPKMDAMMGEDLTFCQRIRKAGYDIWYEPRAIFLHQRKASFLTLQDYAATLESLQSQDVVEVDGDLHSTDIRPADSQQAG